MFRSIVTWLLAAMVGGLLTARPALAVEPGPGPLVSVEWLERNLASGDFLLLDASQARSFAANHIPGAVNVDLYSFGVQDPSIPELERRIQSWGVSPGRKIVIYDQGGSMMATRLFFDLLGAGVPVNDLRILDGGLHKWQQTGGAVTKESTPAPPKGSFRVTTIDDGLRVRLPEFVGASGDPSNTVLVDALGPSYHFGDAKFFDRAGHIPNSILLPAEDFFNADKTFKSAEEIRRMASHHRVKPEQQILTYCGGGVAASVPFFALKFLAGYPRVKLYKESELEWMRDDRALPVWTYGAPYLRRDMDWVQGWGNRMVRSFGVANLSVVDVRHAEAYGQGHVPFALNIPAEAFRSRLADRAKLAELLGGSGMNATHEAVIVSEGGLNARSALAFLMLEWAGQKRVSILMESVVDWGMKGYPLAKEATVVGTPKSPADLAVPATTYVGEQRAGVLIREPRNTEGPYPKVYIASGAKAPAGAPDGKSKIVHLPHTDLLNTDGTPKPASEIWKLLDKAGIPRYAELVCIADDPGEAAVNYYVLRLMGYPDVKVLVS